MALTATQVTYAKPGRHADRDGLYLVVRPGGSKAWVLRIQVDGKRQDFGLGSAKKVSLSAARTLAIDVRGRLQDGKTARPTPVPPPVIPPAEISFEYAAKACHEAIKPGWRNPHHSATWLTSLEIHVFPHFGSTTVEDVTPAMVLSALAPIWLKIPETARRILQRIRTILEYAHIMGWCAHEMTLRSVPRGLPRQPRDEGHFVSMPYGEVPALLELLDSGPETAGRDALVFTILTAVRSGETRFASWPEFDLEKRLWSIPAARMKMRQPHVVPLSPGAVAVLRRRWPLRLSDHGYVLNIRR